MAAAFAMAVAAVAGAGFIVAAAAVSAWLGAPVAALVVAGLAPGAINLPFTTAAMFDLVFAIALVLVLALPVPVGAGAGLLDVFMVAAAALMAPAFPIFAAEPSGGAACVPACCAAGAAVAPGADAASSKAAKGPLSPSWVVAGACCHCVGATAAVALTCDAILDTAEPPNSDSTRSLACNRRATAPRSASLATSMA
ncbi:MAG TPA: hypothetical protein VMR17_26020 [Xanthobacteraceae bacterium]|nr:hypothetical protein [Xanthobacteraceae bacterium]